VWYPQCAGLCGNTSVSPFNEQQSRPAGTCGHCKHGTLAPTDSVTEARKERLLQTHHIRMAVPLPTSVVELKIGLVTLPVRPSVFTQAFIHITRTTSTSLALITLCSSNQATHDRNWNPTNKVFLEKLTIRHTIKKIPRLLWNFKVQVRGYNTQPLKRIMRQTHPDHIPTPSSFKIHCKSIHPLCLHFSDALCPSGFATETQHA
jgi:hypothetical protein